MDRLAQMMPRLTSKTLDESEWDAFLPDGA